jgi:hypothetical protein
MLPAQNEPYVKIYKDDVLTNPIELTYPGRGGNRKQRRLHMQKKHKDLFTSYLNQRGGNMSRSGMR